MTTSAAAAAESVVVNDPFETEQADEFRRIVAKMEQAASENRAARATLACLDMTVSCVEVRQVRAECSGRTVIIPRSTISAVQMIGR